MTPKHVLLLAFNEGERGKMRMHFPTGPIVIPGNAFSNTGQVYDVIFYTERVKKQAEEFYLEMTSMAAADAEIQQVKV